MARAADRPVLTFADADAWHAWLDEHHATCDGIWLKIAKQGSNETSVSAKDAIPVALCWGWIDGQVRAVDGDWYLIGYTPRRARSMWSQVNVAHVERLTREGRMQPAGLAQVEAAKRDGRWAAAYAPASNSDVPPQLQAALDADPAAAAAFAALNAANRYAMTWRIQTAKRDDTKARHVARCIEMLHSGERFR